MNFKASKIKKIGLAGWSQVHSIGVRACVRACVLREIVKMVLKRNFCNFSIIVSSVTFFSIKILSAD